MKVTLGHHADYQLIFAGPYGVGKTTALQAISEIEVINTDVMSLEATGKYLVEGKTTTTVGFDYGEVRLPDQSTVALLGLPGQERFADIWTILLGRTVSGVILLIYGDADNALEDCRHWLDILKERQAVRRLAVMVTRLPQPTPSEKLLHFRKLVMEYNPYAPVISADPREKNQVIQAVLMAVGTPDFTQ